MRRPQSPHTAAVENRKRGLLRLIVSGVAALGWAPLLLTSILLATRAADARTSQPLPPNRAEIEREILLFDQASARAEASASIRQRIEVQPNSILTAWIEPTHVTRRREELQAERERGLQLSLGRGSSGRVANLLRWALGRTSRPQRGIGHGFGHGADDTPEPYDRAFHFGGWINADSPADCFDTREEVLLRDADPTVPVQISPKNRCIIARGLWYDPYTGNRYRTRQSLQIDHVVALRNAYYSGAWRWTRPKRCHYANFMTAPYHLLAVKGSENMRKRDLDPSGYLPPRRRFYCDYIHIWLKIKAVWDLEVGDREMEAIREAMRIGRCDPNKIIITEEELRLMRAATEDIPRQCQRVPRPRTPTSGESPTEPGFVPFYSEPEI